MKLIRPVLLLALAAIALAAEPKTTVQPNPGGITGSSGKTITATKGPWEDTSMESKAVIKVLQKSNYRFTPEVKSTFLAWSKARALAEISKTGQSLPMDFLNWVDSDPVVAATVYGFTETAARRLVVLRSLELDLGKDEVRNKHLQLALSLADLHASQVDPAVMANEAHGISLKERGLLELRITRRPCQKVDTHPKDRPLDMNDHIINFLEDHPITVEKKVVKDVDGKKVETTEKTTRPAFAYEVYSNPELVKKFNDFMTGHGFKMELDCGKGQIIPAHWGGGRDIVKAYKLFRTAYEAKGLLPQGPDPRPTPGELAAYLIRNDNYRFPPDVKRGWPRFPLNAPWPVLDFLTRSGESLREREFVWDRFRTTGSVVGYGAYIGQIAQYPDLVKARKLQPFDFTYDTYPMRLKDGGVCGTCSNIGRFSSIALGVPAAQASQPSHSCFVAVSGSEQKGFGLAIGQAVSGPNATSVSGRGRYFDQVIKFYPINHGLLSYLECLTAMEIHRLLPASTPESSHIALLTSAFEINPYHLPVVTELLNHLTNPVDLVSFWQKFEHTLTAIEKPGCPKTGHYNTAAQKVLDARLTQLSPPTNNDDLRKVTGFLETRADPIWLKYQLASIGLPRLKEILASDLRISISGTRTPSGCALLAGRLSLTGSAIKDKPELRIWATRLLEIINGKTLYTSGTGKAAKEYVDPCTIALHILAGSSPATRMEFERDLKAAVQGSRTSATCDIMVKRLDAITREIKNPKERAAWGNTLLDLMAGHEIYAPPNAPTRLTIDPLVGSIYETGCDLTSSKEEFEADLKASVAGTRTTESTRILALRLNTLIKGIRAPKERKAWAETLLPIITGRESHTITVTLPKKQGTKQVEVEDPCVRPVYALLGRKSPAQIQAEEAKTSAIKASLKK